MTLKSIILRLTLMYSAPAAGIILFVLLCSQGNPVIGTIVLLVGLLAGLYMVIANIRRLIYGQQWTTPRDIVAILRGLRAKERDHHDQHDAGLDLVADHDPTRERHA